MVERRELGAGRRREGTALIAGSRASRLTTLAPHWDALVALAWENLCRQAVPRLTRGALFVPRRQKGDLRRIGDVHIVTLDEMI